MGGGRPHSTEGETEGTLRQVKTKETEKSQGDVCSMVGGGE